VFFVQAEDGIRDRNVTGVQTCALPISIRRFSRVVLTHDIAQRDNLRIGRYDGIASVVEALKEHELFAHVTLQRSERSKVAELVKIGRASCRERGWRSVADGAGGRAESE